MNTKTRGALLSIAVALLLATVVTWSGLSARAMPDMRNSPAFDTLNEAPVWTSRYLRSTASMTTTDESNGEERVAWPDIPAKLAEWFRKRLGLHRDTVPQPKKESDAVPLLKEDSGKVKAPEEISKNKKSVLDAFKKWWASAINSLFHKDDEVKRLVKNVKDVKTVISILENKHFQRWFNMERSAEDIHGLLGLPTGPALLESPLLWIWLDYAIWIGQSPKKPMDTISVFEKMFGNNAVIAKMFENVRRVKEGFGMKNKAMDFKNAFLRNWLMREHELEQLRASLEQAGCAKEEVEIYVKKYNHYHPAPKAPDVLGPGLV